MFFQLSGYRKIHPQQVLCSAALELLALLDMDSGPCLPAWKDLLIVYLRPFQ